jgi:hypothetical protein
MLGIIATGVFSVLGITIKLAGDVRDVKSDLRNHIKECDRRFYTLANDFKLHVAKTR